VVAAVVVAAVFLLAAITKLARPAAWRVQSADLGVPRPVAAIVPSGEAVIGALLLVQFHRQLVAWCAVGVLVAFTLLLLVRLAQGRRPPCACFGSWSATPISPASIVRNLVFIAVAVAAAWW
jgi:uncharacterized membrane protein YphA (DoxX/SURF4 family)